MGDYIYRTRECKKKASAIIESRLSSIVLMVITLFACTLPTNSNAMTREFEEETKEALGAPVTELDTLKIDWVQRIESADTRKALQEVFDQLSSLAQELCNRLPNIIKSSGGERLRPTMDALNEVFSVVLTLAVSLRNQAATLDRWSRMSIMKQCHGLIRRATECAAYGEVLMLRTAQTVRELRTDFHPEEISGNYAGLLEDTKKKGLETFNFNQAREDRFDKVSEKIKYIIDQEGKRFVGRMIQAGQSYTVQKSEAAQAEQELDPEAVEIMDNILREIGAMPGRQLGQWLEQGPTPRPLIAQQWGEPRTGISGAGLPTQDIWSIERFKEGNFERRFPNDFDYYKSLKRALLLTKWAITYLRTMDIREEAYSYEYAHFVVGHNKDINKDIKKLKSKIRSEHELINTLQAQFNALQSDIIALTTPLGMSSAKPLMGSGQAPQSALEMLEQATTGMGREFEMRSRETTLGPVSTLEVPRHLVETTLGGYKGTLDQKTREIMSELGIFEDDIYGTKEAWRRLYPDISSKQAVLAKMRELKARNVDEWERSFESIVSEMSDDYPVGKAVLYRDGIRALRHAYIQALMAELPQLKQLVEQYYEQLKNAWDKLVIVYGLQKFVKVPGFTAEDAAKDLNNVEEFITTLENISMQDIQRRNKLYGIIANRFKAFEEKLPLSRRDHVEEPWKSLIERREKLFTRFRAIYKAYKAQESGVSGAGSAAPPELKPGQPVRGAGFPAPMIMTEFVRAANTLSAQIDKATAKDVIELRKAIEQLANVKIKVSISDMTIEQARGIKREAITQLREKLRDLEAKEPVPGERQSEPLLAGQRRVKPLEETQLSPELLVKKLREESTKVEPLIPTARQYIQEAKENIAISEERAQRDVSEVAAANTRIHQAVRNLEPIMTKIKKVIDLQNLVNKNPEALQLLSQEEQDKNWLRVGLLFDYEFNVIKRWERIRKESTPYMVLPQERGSVGGVPVEEGEVGVEQELANIEQYMVPLRQAITNAEVKRVRRELLTWGDVALFDYDHNIKEKLETLRAKTDDVRVQRLVEEHDRLHDTARRVLESMLESRIKDLSLLSKRQNIHAYTQEIADRLREMDALLGLAERVKIGRKTLAQFEQDYVRVRQEIINTGVHLINPTLKELLEVQ